MSLDFNSNCHFSNRTVTLGELGSRSFLQKRLSVVLIEEDINYERTVPFAESGNHSFIQQRMSLDFNSNCHFRKRTVPLDELGNRSFLQKDYQWF
jgi:hypothetical protein